MSVAAFSCYGRETLCASTLLLMGVESGCEWQPLAVTALALSHPAMFRAPLILGKEVV